LCYAFLGGENYDWDFLTLLGNISGILSLWSKTDANHFPWGVIGVGES